MRLWEEKARENGEYGMEKQGLDQNLSGNTSWIRQENGM